MTMKHYIKVLEIEENTLSKNPETGRILSFSSLSNLKQVKVAIRSSCEFFKEYFFWPSRGTIFWRGNIMNEDKQFGNKGERLTKKNFLKEEEITDWN